MPLCVLYHSIFDDGIIFKNNNACHLTLPYTKGNKHFDLLIIYQMASLEFEII